MDKLKTYQVTITGEVVLSVQAYDEDEAAATAIAEDYVSNGSVIDVTQLSPGQRDD